MKNKTLKRSPITISGTIFSLIALSTFPNIYVFAEPRVQEPVRPPISLETLRSDPHLQRNIQCAFHQERLDIILQEISHKAGATLTVTPNLAPWRLTGRITMRPASSFMVAMGQVLHISWRSIGNGYELFQTPEQQEADIVLKRRSEAREQDFLRTQAEELRQQVARALSINTADHEVFSDFVSGCDPKSVEQGLTSALEDEPIISATDQSHFHNHLFAVQPFSSLLPAQQGAVSQIAHDCGYRHLSGESQVGLIAAAGSFRLGIVQSDGRDVWVAPGHQIGRVAGLNANNRENDFDSDVVRQLQSEEIADLSRMPDAQHQKKWKLTKPIDASHLSVLLEEVCGAGNIDFVCDCYLNSNTTNYGFVFRPDSEWTVVTALKQVARTFAHKMVYVNGYLEATTVVRGLDVRLEPSADVMNALDAEAKSQLPSDSKDFLLLSHCTKDQIGLLVLRHPAARVSMHLLSALRIYPMLHFYGTLTKMQQKKALAEQGIGSAELDIRQRDSFDALVATGLPKSAPMNLKKSHFYVKLSSEGRDRGKNREIVSFVLTLSNDDTRCRSGDLL
ncbi:MAG: hypothetical protein JWL77_3262 [Chthonomonadaceae bacterium]|nr:hypothetical protein [Chthonomonadaceae bacterium]